MLESESLKVQSEVTPKKWDGMGWGPFLEGGGALGLAWLGLAGEKKKPFFVVRGVGVGVGVR
jgi:hypothetical protein